jgi:predicted permease
MQAFPELACSFFLSILIPMRFIQKVIKRMRKLDKEETVSFKGDFINFIRYFPNAVEPLY